MATIKVKRSAVAGRIPATTDLELGEIAINTYDGVAYIKKNVSGTETVVSLGGNVELSQNLQNRYQYTATANQTTFAAVYLAPYVDVYLNGVRLLIGVEFTATNGTSIVLASGASAGNVVDIVAYTSYTANANFADLNSTHVTTALGFTPYNATNPSNFITQAQARGAISASGSLSYNSSTGVISYTTPTTSGITEGTNLYFTDARARGAVSAGTGLTYNSSTGVITNSITQYTDALARAAISVTGAGSYNSTTGVITVTGGVTSVAGRTGAVTLTNADVGLGSVEDKSSATIRGEITSSNVTAALGFTPYNATNPSNYITSADARSAISATGSLSYNSTTGVLSYTAPTAVSAFTNDSGYLTANQSISVTGDATGSGATAISLTLANSGVTAGTYTKTTVDVKGRVTSGSTLSASDIPALDASKITTGVFDAARLPSYVDDVLEYANLAGFPASGETGKIYVALDTNKTYRWSGSAYVYITSGAVDSVAGKTGVVTLTNADVGLGLVENKSSATIRGEISSTNVTSALGFTPYNATNPNGYISSITSANVTTALGFTPYNGTNPSGYITSSALSGYLTSASAASTYLALAGGTTTGTTTLVNNFRFHIGGETGTGVADFRVNTSSKNLVISAPDTGAVFLNFDHGTGGVNFCNGAAVVVGSVSSSGAANFVGALTQNGSQVLHAGNVNSYALPIGGGTLTGVTLVKRNLGTNDYTIVGQHNLHLRLQRSSDLKTLELGVLDNGTGVVQANEAGVGYQTLALNPVAGAVTVNGQTVLNAGNYNSYSPTLTGTGASGTWGINITGTANNITAYTINQNLGTGNQVQFDSVITTNNGNGTNIRLGDDVWIGDCNLANTFRIRGLGDAAQGYIVFGSDLTQLGRSGTGALAWGGNALLTAGNYNSYSPTLTGGGASGTWGISITGTASGNIPRSGSWLGDLASYGYTREHGISMTGGSEFVVLSKSGQGFTLVDGSYIAFEGGGFYSSSNSSGGTMLGFTSDTTSSLNFNTTTVKLSGNQILHAGNYSSYAQPLLGYTAAYGNGAYQSKSLDTVSTPGLYQYDGAFGGTKPPDNAPNYRTIEIGNDSRFSQIALPWSSENMYFRRQTGASWSNWRTVIHDGNYNSYAPTLTGGNASGTWGINVTGTASGETLSTVTGRGGVTSNSVNLASGSNRYQGHFYYDSYDPAGNHYPHFTDGGNASGVKINWRLYTGGTNSVTHYWGTDTAQFVTKLESTVRVDAPIFYDRNDTGRYVDPNSGSVMQTVYANYFCGLSGNAYGIYKGYDNNNHFIGIRCQVGGNTTSPSLTGAHQMTFVEYAEANDSSGWFFKTSETGNYDIVSRITRSYSHFNSSVRSPLFYDSDNTGHYVDPASTSQLNVANANRFSAPNSGLVSVGDDSATYTYNDSSTRSRVYVSSQYPVLTLNSNVGSANPDHGPTLQFTHNGYDSNRQWVIGTPGTGAFLDFGTGQSSIKNPHDGISGYGGSGSGKTLMRMTTTGVGIGGNWGSYGTVANPSYPLHVQGTGLASSDFRAPIFYDSNNTGYYCDPNSTSNFVGLTVDGRSLNLGMYYQGFTLDANTMNTNATGFTYAVNAPTVGPVVRFSTGGGYDMWLNAAYSGGNHLYFRTRNGDAGSINGWRVLASYGQNYGDSLFATSFYDANDTGYYADPNGTSNLNSVTINGTLNAYANPIKVNRINFTTTGGSQASDPYCFRWRSETDGDTGSQSWLELQMNDDAEEEFRIYGYSCSGYGCGALSSNLYHRFYANGNAWHAGNVTAYSDARVKENVVAIENAVDKVMQIRGVTFTRNDRADTTTRHAGVIAQEVEIVLPEVVTTDEDGMKSVAYGNMVGLLIEAIKEQQAQIAELKRIINEIR